MREEDSTLNITKLVVAIIILAIGVFASFTAVENLDADEIMVVQNPFTGSLTWYTSPGPKPQFFGKVTRYSKRDQYWFEKEGGKHGQKDSRPLRVRFNDGAHATISGSISWEMPLDPEHLTQLHSQYGSRDAIELQLVRTVIEKSVYMTGPLMSSAESYAAKRNELLSFIEDQVHNGVYKTDARNERVKDSITGQDRTIQVVDIVKKKDGTFERETTSPLIDFRIKTFNLSINEVEYDPEVEKQIEAQQKAVMDVQTAIAQSKTAEQKALTTEQEGKAKAAVAKWEQEVKKATAVTEAQQKLEVSALDALALKTNAVIQAQRELEVADFTLQAAQKKKETEIILGEGESKRRQLVMAADGALEKKLEAWVAVNKSYAEAIKGYQGQWVPSVMMGGGGNSGTGGDQIGPADFMNLIATKMALDLGLEMKLKPAIVPVTAQK
ncbi:MAG: hypothetical protein A3A22_00235 [Candidatus Taylorbacteria bacterium RIFCSPLOWO2_01_FULL_45_34b]|nr:MAG: hypothetical protein A3A22_00235 [Candidatus Taylorbacteria bacterium RIFCSPLOWO2_01_FULL_45_34b]